MFEGFSLKNDLTATTNDGLAKYRPLWLPNKTARVTSLPPQK